MFCGAALATLAAGVVLERSGDAIARYIGLSGVLFDATVLAASTLSPVLSTGITSVRMKDCQLAVSDSFDGNAILPVLFSPSPASTAVSCRRHPGSPQERTAHCDQLQARSGHVAISRAASSCSGRVMMLQLRKVVGCGLACLTAAAAAAEDSNADRLCSERPGLTTSACITAPGRLQTETALAGWTLERQADERRDTILIGDTLVRYGIGGKAELRVEWSPYGAERDRDADGKVSHAHRVGDATVGVKTSLIERTGDNGLALSAIASATLPVGRRPIGAGDWGASFELPATYRTSKQVSLQATPIVAAAVNDDGHGRHALYGNAVEVEYALSDTVRTDISAQVVRDDDPDRKVRGTPALGSAAFAWQPDSNTQIDLGANVGLDKAAPRIGVFAGVSHRFGARHSS